MRDIELRDEAALVAYFAEPAAQPQILTRQRSPDYVRTLVKTATHTLPEDQRRHFNLAVEVKATGEFIGICTLTHAEKGSTYAQLGWHISQAYWGKGYATESGREALRLAFEQKAVREIHSDCFEHNERAQRVLKKLGMRQNMLSGFKKWWVSAAYGEADPIVRYAIDRGAWKGAA